MATEEDQKKTNPDKFTWGKDQVKFVPPSDNKPKQDKKE